MAPVTADDVIVQRHYQRVAAVLLYPFGQLGNSRVRVHRSVEQLILGRRLQRRHALPDYPSFRDDPSCHALHCVAPFSFLAFALPYSLLPLVLPGPSLERSLRGDFLMSLPPRQVPSKATQECAAAASSTREILPAKGSPLVGTGTPSSSSSPAPGMTSGQLPSWPRRAPAS